MPRDNELQIVVSAEDEATAVLQQVQGSVENTTASITAMSAAAAAAGAAIVAALGAATFAAAEEEAGILRLKVAMDNVGINYDQVSGSLERWIDLQQQKTAFGDEQQRASLASLIRMTRDLTEAQELLTLAMDIAIGTGRDLESATTLITYAMGGNWGMLEQYIPALGKVTDEQEKWNLLQEMFAGQAETYGSSVAGQMQLVKANVGDLAQSLGEVFLPTVNTVLGAVNALLQKLKAMPEPLKQILGGGAAVSGVLLTLVGTAGLVTKAWPMLTGVLTTGANVLRTQLIPALVGAVQKMWAFATAIVTRVIPALIAKLGLLGPAGWAILAASAGIIAGAIVGINRLVSGAQAEIEIPEIEGIEIPSAQYGRFIPGTRGGTLVRVGENYTPEEIVPLRRAVAQTITNTFNIQQMVVREEADIQRVASELFRMQQRGMRMVT